MSHAEIERQIGNEIEYVEIGIIYEEPDPSKLWRDALNRHIGQKIKARRKHLRMSQTTLGQHVGLTFQQVQKYEYGTNRLSAARMFDMARVLGVHPMLFVAGFDDAAFVHDPIVQDAAAIERVCAANRELNAAIADAFFCRGGGAEIDPSKEIGNV